MPLFSHQKAKPLSLPPDLATRSTTLEVFWDARARVLRLGQVALKEGPEKGAAQWMVQLLPLAEASLQWHPGRGVGYIVRQLDLPCNHH